ncbi:hypothetical protein [Enterococcus hermanniensis]|uniref:YolD-like protein n=1 Tax=Enterococcus hermanniensis TaxID=249189 RepID=A0A1L8TM90_9ENTE|nr:hypothetical protein [Enterococcus hermanniensis]OJG45204.1 hypothetical protein RV04_GL002252 [Enterococcus hermanniensis]
MIYDDESAKKLFLEAKRVYQDRGMLKWVGFYLSDHTAVLAKDSQQRSQINKEKQQMSMEEIGVLLQQAYVKRSRIALQLSILDSEGDFHNDLIGKVTGQRENLIFINEEKQGILQLTMEQIHHAEIILPSKIFSQKNKEIDE